MNLTNNVRYSIFPQLIEYDSMAPGKFVPYAMLSGPSCYNGERIHTDKHGFRVSQDDNYFYSIEDIEKYKEINIIVGGSTAFGVGATNDKNTISSMLSIQKGEVWLNLGIRGCNSFQEIIHLNRFLFKAVKVKKIVFFSGVNDLYLRLVNETTSDFDYGFGTKFTSIAAFHPYRQAIAVFLGLIYNVDPKLIIDKSIKEVLLWPFFKGKYIDKDTKSDLTLEKKIELYLEQYKRNFSIYHGIGMAHNCEIHFVMQPLIFWSNKNVSENEFAVLKYLDDLQKDDYWGEIKNKLSDIKIKNKIVNYLESLAKSKKISFFDANDLFVDVNEDCFVDSVHLTDYGNKLIANYISKL